VTASGAEFVTMGGATDVPATVGPVTVVPAADVGPGTDGSEREDDVGFLLQPRTILRLPSVRTTLVTASYPALQRRADLVCRTGVCAAAVATAIIARSAVAARMSVTRPGRPLQIV
jgi:hypothetical protein